MCGAYGTQGHPIQERTILVGNACEKHSMYQTRTENVSLGYGTTQSIGGIKAKDRRWNILPTVTGVSCQAPPLIAFEADDWVAFMICFPRGSLHRPLSSPRTSPGATSKLSGRALSQPSAPSSPDYTSSDEASKVNAGGASKGEPANDDSTTSETLSHRNALTVSDNDDPMDDIGLCDRHIRLPVQEPDPSRVVVPTTAAKVVSEDAAPGTPQPGNSASEEKSNGHEAITDKEVVLKPQASSYLNALRVRLLKPEEYLTYLKELEYDIWLHSATTIYDPYLSSVSMVNRYRKYHLFVRYPDVSPKLSRVLPEALSDMYISSICRHVRVRDAALLDQLHEIRVCRNVIVKTYLNLRMLQDAGFCTEYFSFITIDDDRHNVAQLRRFDVNEVLALTTRIEYILRNYIDMVLVDAPTSSCLSRLSSFVPGLQNWCHDILPFRMSLLMGSELGLVRILQLLVHILDLAVVSYAGAHLRNFVQEYLQQHEHRVDLLGPFSDSTSAPHSVVFQRCPLQCLGAFLHDKLVWVFSSSLWNSRSPLYLSTCIEVFADIWGPLWKAKDPSNQNRSTAYIVGNGSIVPWQHFVHRAPRLEGEVFCHWMADDEWENDAGAGFLDNVPISFDGSETLLIGAQTNVQTGERVLAVNSTCAIAVSAAREHLRDVGRLSILGTQRPYRYNDGVEYQLQVGYSGVNATIAKQYKRVPGQSLKNILIELWAMEPDMRDPALLHDLYGLEVSLCTYNAQRVSLSHLLSLDCLRTHLRNFNWENDKYEARYYDALKEHSSQKNRSNDKFSDKFDRAVMLCLKALSKTGVDRKGHLLVFLTSKCTPKPELATLVPKEHSWIGLLRDTTTDCTMAAFGDSCLEFKHKIGVSCGGTGRSVLRTALVPNSESPLQVVRKSESSTRGSEIWAERWDVSSLRVGSSIWLGERGTLSLVSHLTDDTLLMEWRSSPVMNAVKFLISREQPHREFSEIDHSGQQLTRPIPVFVISHHIGD